MAIQAKFIETSIKKSFPHAKIILKDMVGDGDHYALKIICDTFEGMTRVQRHQKVYKALGSIVGNELHALSITALTPQEKD